MDGLTISYDFGEFSSPLTEWEGDAEYERAPAVVDGRDAVIVTARDASAAEGLGFLAGIHIDKLTSEGAKLTMYAGCAGEAQRTLALKTFTTIRFDR